MAHPGSQSYYDLVRKNQKPVRLASKPRTPADIGLAIGKHEARIAALKAELADVPPTVLVLDNIINNGTVTFDSQDSGGRAVDIEVRLPHSSTITLVLASDMSRLRAWLNHYYPAKEA